MALCIVLLSSASAPAQELEAEIKLFVVEDKIDEAKKQIDKEFKPAGPVRHEIYFFDTAALGLYENAAGPVILRARQKGSKEPQSTVKLRRDKRDADLEKKLAADGLKIEIEAEAIVGKEGPAGISYALDAKPGKKLSELEGASGQKISEWFSADQKKFLEAAGIKVDWGDLKVFGRIDADVWEWEEKDKRVGTKVTVELWPLGEKRIYELSCKKKGGDPAKQKEDFAAFFKEKKIPAADDPPSKTRQALDYFSRKTTSQPKPIASTLTDRWQKVGDGKLMGIGGMALLGSEGNNLSFLIVHDNKKAGEARAGILRCERGGEPKYQRLDWPDTGTALPEDLEALTAIPGARGEYLAATSKGSVWRIKASSSQQSIEVLRKIDDIPGATEESEIEGFALATLGDNIVAAWADRGDDEKAATFSWANFDATRNELTDAESTTIKVPWPEKNARDVSDIRIDSAGAVFITSAYESKDDATNATFASAVYLAGVLKREGKQIRFSQNTDLTRLYHFDGRKIEAVELVPGAQGGLILATDDEHQGSSVYLGW